MCFLQLYIIQLSFVGNEFLHLKKYEKYSRKMYKNVINVIKQQTLEKKFRIWKIKAIKMSFGSIIPHIYILVYK